MLPSLFVRMASLLVPAAGRDDWRREWEAEIWYAREDLSARGEIHAVIDAELRRFARGAFRDAAWQRWGKWNRERFGQAIAFQSQCAGFCLGALTFLLALIALASGFLPVTRAILLPLPYRDAGQIATVSQAGPDLATRSPVPMDAVRLWRAKSRLLDGIATYSWETEAAGGSKPLLRARVSENFFYLLGAKTASGREFGRGDLRGCAPEDCVVLSYGFVRRHAGPGGILKLSGRSYRVAAVLDKRFWFLSRRIAVWTLGDPVGPAGVVVRLRPGVTPREAEAEMGSILRDSGSPAWRSLVQVSPVPARVRSVFGSFALGAVLAIVIAMASFGRRFAGDGHSGSHRAPARAAFFAIKTTLLLTAVLLCGLEFAGASSITMLGGTDTLTEPLSTWLFLMGSMGALFWSIQDQRRRCPVCLRRLGLAVHVGCPGCLLLDWAGTELVCLEGHGMLHVPELVSCWHEPSRWTSLDDTWQELFSTAHK
ncbi:MAG TPA: ABC transporter permease [Bryobacteraceae bacterium]|nr:ABC transporter permease [Bryobacteraceae bacterium]